MAYVICVCGAGGKTTYCYELAQKKALENNKVCILTTTHMWNDNNLSDIKSLPNVEAGLVYFFGVIDGEKITFVSESDYEVICKKFDFVIIEADGSKSFPMKIPDIKREPVIPINVNEIVVVYGTSALDRKIGVVCQRFNDFIKSDEYLLSMGLKYDTYTTKNIYDNLKNHYYIDILKKKYMNVKVVSYDTNMLETKNYLKIKNIAIVICASGFSSRFGSEDKLCALIKGKKMYELMINKIINVKDLLVEKYKKNANYDLNVSVAITVRDNLYNCVKEYGTRKNLIPILNNNADKGLSNSIKIATEKFIDSDAIMFINCDLPYLSENEIVYFLYNSINSNSSIASMFTDVPKNPAYFEKYYFNELMKIDGDIGPKELLKINKKKLFKYHIDEKELIDIDTKEDIK